MRRTVATILVVASPLLLATPVSADPAPGPAVPTAPGISVPVAAAAPAVAPPASTIVPGVPAPVAGTARRAHVIPAARHAVKAARAKAPAAADPGDAAYAAKLAADLCLARQIFCGLDHNGRYPAS